MKILFLGYEDSPLIEFLRKEGHRVIVTQNNLNSEWGDFLVKWKRFDFLISYGYQHLIRASTLAALPNRAINLHISYLPWNRGADPNLWSFIDGTPKGVTIHHMNEGLDKGDIIAQKEISFQGHQTLATTYKILHEEIQELFKENWPDLSTGKAPRIKQEGAGSYHKSADKNALSHLLLCGWDTPVNVLIEYGVAQRTIPW